MLVLVIQRGHVPRKTGSTGTAGEQAMTKGVAAEVKRLTPPGWVTKVIDADVARNAYKGSVFVAVHGDGSTNRKVQGASVGYWGDDDAKLAERWKKAYKARGWVRGFHPDNYTLALHHYYGTRMAQSVGTNPAIIIEVGTMTNPADRAWIDKHHTDIAKSIWDAVSPAWEATPTNHSDYRRTSIAKLHLRAKPSMRGAIIKTLPKGTRLRIISGSTPLWAHVRLDAKTTGYVWRAYAPVIR